MRLVVWNCHQGLDKKIGALADLRPDVAIVPECASPQLPRLANALAKYGISQSFWSGSNQQKGLGLFVFNNAIHAESSETTGGRYTIKIDLKIGAEVSIIAMWTQAPGYVEEAHSTVEAYKEIFKQKNVILAGDFNSNKIWDSSRTLNHSELVKRLTNEFSLHSVYHHHFCEEQGRESRPTLCFTYNEQKPYHVDYVFIPEKWLSKIKAVELGEFKNWKHLSDHCPLIVEIDI